MRKLGAREGRDGSVAYGVRAGESELEGFLDLPVPHRAPEGGFAFACLVAERPWLGEAGDTSRVMAALPEEDGAVRNLIACNAALRVWMSGGASGPLEESVERVRAALDSGSVMKLMGRLDRG